MDAVSAGRVQWGMASSLALMANVIGRTKVSGEVVDGGQGKWETLETLGNVGQSSV